MSTYYATEQNDDSGGAHGANLHIKGTIVKNRNGKTFTEFWMTAPRPSNIGLDEWEKIQDAKWNRIFGGKNERCRA